MPDRLAELEAENARLRATLAQQNEALGRLNALSSRESQIRLVADSLPVLISYVDADQCYRFNNKVYERWFGQPRRELFGRHLRDVMGVDAYEEIRSIVEAALAGERVSADRNLTYGDGEQRSVHVEYVPDRAADGHVAGFFALVQDISERQRVEAELRESEARFRAMADSAAAPVWVTNEGGIEFVNQAMIEFAGIPGEKLTGDVWMSLVHPDDLPPVLAVRAQAWQDKEPYSFEARFRRADGEWRWMRASCNPRRDGGGAFQGYVGVALDLTDSRRAEDALRELNQTLEIRIADAIAERERAEEALRQSQKMEAVGQLTGGIAHDFNNLLTVITGNLDAARRRLGEDADPRLLRSLASALVGAERAATLTQRLLAFSRRQPLSPKPIDANALVTGMSDLLHRTLGETIRVETVLAPGLWWAEVDPHQLENALLNIAVNARDAMPEGGSLTIETDNVEAVQCPGDADLAPSPCVLIRLTDTGLGMDPDMAARACEPFFTTKEVGKGTGLGLSMVYGFVKQSGGHFEIVSQPEQGTVVSLYLPRLAREVSAEEERLEPTDLPGGHESVLVCEDDVDVRAYTVEALRDLGYRVIEAEDGATALRELEEDGEVDLLFTDVVLPGGMTGAEMARRAVASRPGLKVLFTTGYARDAIGERGRLDAGIELITKPFAVADLAARIRKILDFRP